MTSSYRLWVRALLMVGFAGCGARSSHPVGPTQSACPATCDGPARLALLDEVYELEIRLAAAFQACEGERREFQFSVDGRPIGLVEVPCVDVVGVVRAPPRSYGIHSEGLRAGTHTLVVHEAGSGLRAEAELTLPALAVTSDGDGVLAGAHVRVWVDDSISIGEPSAMMTMGL